MQQNETNKMHNINATLSNKIMTYFFNVKIMCCIKFLMDNKTQHMIQHQIKHSPLVVLRCIYVA